MYIEKLTQTAYDYANDIENLEHNWLEIFSNADSNYLLSIICTAQKLRIRNQLA